MRGGIQGGSGRARRIAVWASAAAIAALSLSAAATAKKQSYDGPIFDSFGSVEFQLKREEGKRYVMHFHVDDLPYSCPNGTSKTIDFGIRRMRVRDRRFSGSTDFGAGGGRHRKVADVIGRLKGRNRAEGTVDFKDKFDAVSICESGEMAWAASR